MHAPEISSQEEGNAEVYDPRDRDLLRFPIYNRKPHMVRRFLCAVALVGGSPVVSQIMALERELASLDAEIAHQERAMNALIYGPSGLSAEEIEMVEKG
jgi:hypothetical protein